jgi:hypothetical protein
MNRKQIAVVSGLQQIPPLSIELIRPGKVMNINNYYKSGDAIL